MGGTQKAILFVAFHLLLVGCASTGAVEKAREPQHWITGEEVRDTGLDDLHMIVRRLRPRWFIGENIVVYLNRSPMGGLDALRYMDPNLAYALEWMGVFRAVEELPAVGYRGADDLDGVIVVWTRPPGR